ncbi:MAG: S8 family serine peptidase, partial [Caedimonadaceae bacterium]
MKGQGQTVAVIELSGEWQQIKDVANGKYGKLPPERKANYKFNFLTPIGGPGLHPEEMNDWVRDRGNDFYHGSGVSSVVLDLAPQAKVLPVSTYLFWHSDEFYDVADALMDLSRRSDVGIINMSSGYAQYTHSLKTVHKQDGTKINLFKTIYRPKLVEAFKAVAKAGKVVVIAAGNQGIPIQVPEFVTSEENVRRQDLFGHLMQELDPETRQSVILAGSYDPETRKIASYSNKPGSLKNAQDAFLFAPGKHLQQYDYMVGDGTSLAAPYICATIANLASKRNITPKRAV